MSIIVQYGKYTIWPPKPYHTGFNEGFTLKDNGTYLRGVYLDLPAAIRAADLFDQGKHSEIAAMSDRVCGFARENRHITIKDLEGI